MSKSPKNRHFIIPDTQVKPGVPLDHIDWVAQAIVDYAPDKVIMLGDHWDMPSLSSYEKPGSIALEGARYEDDITSGCEAFSRLSAPMFKEIRRQSRNKNQWDPERHFLFGNHCDRITRAANADAKMSGCVSLRHCVTDGWARHAFLKKIEIDGICFSHYFAGNGSKFPVGGSIDNRLNKIGCSFVQGHQQGMVYGSRMYPTGHTRHGLVAGSCYLHHEDYRGNQGQRHWRGVVVLNEVKDGDYCVMPLTLDYLCRRYEGVDLLHFMKKKYKGKDWSFLA